MKAVGYDFFLLVTKLVSFVYLWKEKGVISQLGGGYFQAI